MLQPPKHMLLASTSTSYTSPTSARLTNTTPSQAHLEVAWVGKPGGATDSRDFCQMESQDFCQLPLCKPTAPLRSVPARVSGETGTTWPKPLNFLYFQNYNYRKVSLPKSSEI